MDGKDSGTLRMTKESCSTLLLDVHDVSHSTNLSIFTSLHGILFKSCDFPNFFC